MDGLEVVVVAMAARIAGPFRDAPSIGAVSLNHSMKRFNLNWQSNRSAVPQIEHAAFPSIPTRTAWAQDDLAKHLPSRLDFLHHHRLLHQFFLPLLHAILAKDGQPV